VSVQRAQPGQSPGQASPSRVFGKPASSNKVGGTAAIPRGFQHPVQVRLCSAPSARKGGGGRGGGRKGGERSGDEAKEKGERAGSLCLGIVAVPPRLSGRYAAVVSDSNKEAGA
jgi:hypothetical protein